MKVLLFALIVLVSGQRNVVRTISDAHLGSYRLQNHINIFHDFLDTMKDQNTNVSTLIMLGDFVELWLTDYSTAFRSWYDVIMSPALVMGFNYSQFRQDMIDIANNNIDIMFMWGNHDLEEPNDQEFSAAFKNHARIQKTSNASYFFMGVMYEHGHYYDIFNAPFPPNSNLAKLLNPFGYFASRTLASTNATYSSVSSLQKTTWADKKFAGWTLDSLKDHNNMEVFLWALVTYLGMEPPSNMMIASGNPTNMSQNSTYGQIIPQYNDMINEWVRLKGEDYATNMLIAGVNYDVTPFVKMQAKDVLVNIQGHTHFYVLSRLFRADGSPIVYANSGAWVDVAKQTWVDVVYNGSSIIYVQIGSYNTGKEVMLGMPCYLNETTVCSWAWRSTLGNWHLLPLVFSFVYFLLSH